MAPDFEAHLLSLERLDQVLSDSFHRWINLLVALLCICALGNTIFHLPYHMPLGKILQTFGPTANRVKYEKWLGEVVWNAFWSNSVEVSIASSVPPLPQSIDFPIK